MEPASASASGAADKEKGTKKISSVPETVLKAALLRRAVEDIRRLMELRSQKPALSNLLQKGSVGDDLWQRFLRAEKEMEEEFRDVISEVCLPLSFFFIYSYIFFLLALRITTNVFPFFLVCANRPTPSLRTGARRSSSLPTRCISTRCSAKR